MTDLNNKQLAFGHSGDHHLAKVKYDPNNGAISAGAILGFSDNASAALQINGGKVSGTLIHSGDTHSIKVDVNDDGTFDATYVDKKDGNLEVQIKGGIASVISGEFPLNGVTINSDHHSVTLTRDRDGKLSGEIESMATENSSFKLKIANGVVSGSVTYSGDGHDYTIDVLPGGKWKTSVSLGNGLSFGVENGNAGVAAFAGLKLDF